MSAAHPGKEISEFLRDPSRLSAQCVSKTNPPANRSACQWFERESVQRVLFRVKKDPGFRCDGGFIERPILVAGFDGGVLVGGIGKQALDAFSRARVHGRVVGPTAPSHVQFTALFRMP